MARLDVAQHMMVLEVMAAAVLGVGLDDSSK